MLPASPGAIRRRISLHIIVSMTAYIRAPRSIHGPWKGNVGPGSPGHERVGPETLGARTLFGRGYRGETYSIGRKEKDDDRFCHMSWVERVVWLWRKTSFHKTAPSHVVRTKSRNFEAQQQSALKCLAVSEIVPNSDEKFLLAESYTTKMKKPLC